MERVEIKNNLQELSRLASLIEEFCEKHELGMRITFQINLIIDEIITNIISYGFEDEFEHIIVIELDLQDEILHCSISDDGLAFDPLIVEKPNLDEGVEDRKIGGLGIHFVKTMIDDISYERKDGKNILRFSKNINWEE